MVTDYLLDGDEEIAEYSGATLLHRYLTGPGVDDRIAHVEISPAIKTYYHTNHQGSVMAMTDSAGNVTESMSYDEYGNGTPSTGEQFGYTGRRFDPETGLYYYRARYYAPLNAVSNVSVFRIPDSTAKIFVSAQVKAIYDRDRLTGLDFYPVTLL